MMRKRTSLVVIMLASVCKAQAVVQPATEVFTAVPFAFEENKGQVCYRNGLPANEVKFGLGQGNSTLYLLDCGIAYQFTKVQYPAEYLEMRRSGTRDQVWMEELRKKIMTESFRMDMRLLGADRRCRISKDGRSEDHSNFYNRNISDVHSYTTVTYHDIYPGIDWVVRTYENGIKYDFMVRPGADPSVIKMQFMHQNDIQLGPDGSLTLTNSLGKVTEKCPYSYQEENRVSTHFRLNGNTVSFDIGSYDRQRVLVIDPALVWATYYGGTGIETGWSCATDAAGNVYLAGETNSNSNLIAMGGYQVTFGGGVDAFLAKFNSSGVRMWGTYYGGTGNDYGLSCAADPSGNIYLSGRTSSTFGISSAGHQNSFGGGNFDGFLTKFSATGSLLWATYYGGSGTEECVCATDAAGNVYLAGSTNSSAGIALAGHQNTIGGGDDAFLAKFNSAGLRQWATYVGGANTDNAFACSADALGNVYLSGATTSPSGIAAGAHQNIIAGLADAFLVKFNAGGIRQWGTYYGGVGDDVGTTCATDATNAIYLVGYSSSTLGIASGGHQNTHGGGNFDAFIVKFNGAGSRQWASYYGAAGYEDGQSCATDLAGNIYLSGTTTSTAGIASGLLQGAFGGGQYDGYLVKFNSIGIREWATYFGGNDDDLGLDCTTDAAGNAYLQGQTKSASGIAAGGHQVAYSGGGDAFLAKICSEPGIPGFISGSGTICAGEAHLYSVDEEVFATAYVWNFSGGSSGSSISNSILLVPSSSGTLSVAAQNACGTGALQGRSLIVDECVGISQNSENMKWTVFPNPCSGEFTVETALQGEFSIYDATGRLVLSGTLAHGSNHIQFTTQESGLYLLEFRKNGKTARCRLVKADN